MKNLSHYLVGLLASLLMLPGQAQTASSAAALANSFAPGGTLRVSINLGNAVLASMDTRTGQAVGVSVDLANELARRLAVPVELVVVKSAGASVDNLEQDKADVGFFAIDPKRGQQISFTRPYVLIEGYYAVRKDSPLTSNEQVDQTGITVAVSAGSAYDLFLTRDLQRARIIRTQSSQAVVPTFLDQHLDVAAGVRQQLDHDSAKYGGMRILPTRFMVIRQAMGVPKGRGEAAAAYLDQFVAEMTTSGFVATSLARHRIEGAAVARDGD